MTEQAENRLTDSHKWVRIDVHGDEGSATRAWVNTTSSRVDLGDGLWLYDETQVRTRDWEHDIDIEVEVLDGRLSARSIDVRRHEHSPPITSQTLRALPVATLVSYAGHAVRYGDERGSGSAGGFAWPTPEEGAYVHRYGLDDDTLRIVARIYRVAFLIGDSPTKKVETLLGIPRSTAGRWVTAARAAGYLSKSRGAGKAG